MALSFPLTLAQFSERLRVASMTLHCPAVTEDSRTAAGEIIRASLGAALWQGEMTLAPAYHANAREAQVMLELLLQPGASFLFSPPAYVRAGNATATLSSVNANMRDVSLTNAGANAVLRAGSYISFTYGTNPVRYGFHQIVQTVTASGAGAATVEVTPPIRAGFGANATVQLARPVMKAVLMNRNPGRSAPLITDGISLQFTQTLR